MGSPAVTVLIPTFDRVDFIEGSIRSVLDQTFRDFELVVIDDGSTDGTPELLRRIEDPRLRCIRRERGGISAALNTGLATARGRYVARNDSDDLWLPELLSAQVAALEAAPAAGFAYAVCRMMDADGSPLPALRGRPFRYPGAALSSLLYSDPTSSITTVYRRECFERVGPWDESLPTSQDWDMALRVARHYPGVFVDRVLGHVRLHVGNITGPQGPALSVRMEHRERVLAKAFAEPLPEPARGMRPVAYRNLHLEAGLRWTLAGDSGRARGAFARAFREGGNPAVTLSWLGWTRLRLLGLSRHDAVGRAARALVGWAHRLRVGSTRVLSRTRPGRWRPGRGRPRRASRETFRPR